MTTPAKVNKALKALNINVELVRGNGYYYFDGDAFDKLPSIHANNLRGYTTSEIVEHVKRMLLLLNSK